MAHAHAHLDGIDECKLEIGAIAELITKLSVVAGRLAERKWYVFTSGGCVNVFETPEGATELVGRMAKAGGYTDVHMRLMSYDEFCNWKAATATED